MNERVSFSFSPEDYLATAGPGRRIVKLSPRQFLFSQGDPADSVFYLQKGEVKLTVVSKHGKEATITHLTAGSFLGEESLAQANGVRTTTAVALGECVSLRIARSELERVMRVEPAFAEVFVKYLLARGIRTQADLVDHLFNSSEKRLARTLLLMTRFGKPGEPDPFIAPITQEELAEMVGTTRSRVSYFMNRFRDLGFIDYGSGSCRIQVHRSLHNVVLQDEPMARKPQKQPIPISSRYPRTAVVPRAISDLASRSVALGLTRGSEQRETA